MARKFTSRDWLSKALASGKTIKQVAAKLGRSPSTIRAVAAGKRPGKNLLAGLKAIAQKRKLSVTPVARSSVNRKAAKVLSAVERAQLSLYELDPGTKVVIGVTTKKGRTLVLGRHGGIDVRWLSSLGGFLLAQATAQGYELEGEDFSSVEFEDYEDWS
jgi:transcriptional regulator with XRE-family HTH domain